MYQYHQPKNKVALDAAMYDLLANYYKYLDPQKHMYYYQLHFMSMQQLCQMQLFDVPHFDGLRTAWRAPAKVRVLHVSPDAPKVDIFINGEKTLKNITYYQISPYLDVPAGTYKVDVYPSGKTTNPVLSEEIQVQADKSYTVAAVGKLENIHLMKLEDATNIPKKKAKVRFWHASPNAPAVDIAEKDGDVLFSNVSFGEVAEYLEVAPGKKTLEVRPTGTEDVVLTIRDINLKANEAYTIAAIGLVDGKPRLEALILKP